jgi:hypothetical protein
MKHARKQTNLTKADRFVLRSLGHGQFPLAETFSNAIRRYQVKPHDLWRHIQTTDH